MEDHAENTLKKIHAVQRETFLSEGAPPEKTRIDRLNRAISLLATHHKEICEAAVSDFGCRSTFQTMISDVLSPILTLAHARAHVPEWMAPEEKPVDPPELADIGCKARVVHQPYGVVGVIAPWNYPWNACFSPLAGILAAGNRAMIKPSQKTPACARLMKRLVEQYFEPKEVAVVLPGKGVNVQFTAVPFEHLFFTGSPEVGKVVLRAAADHLTPCTMELGGKNPVVIGPEADLDWAAERIMIGKVMNAGQICLSPDFVLLPAGKEEAFIEKAKLHVHQWFGTIKENDDYTSIIDEAEFSRLQSYLTEASERRVRIEPISSPNEDFGDQRFFKIPPQAIVDPATDLKVMNEEIFGPLLLLKPYTDMKEAVEFINSRPRPLALYYFGDSLENIQLLENKTFSGGMCINDVIAHAAQETLPFGGVGNSGMGSYHGRYGFLAFSHQRAVFEQSPSNPTAKFVLPPYTSTHLEMVSQFDAFLPTD